MLLCCSHSCLQGLHESPCCVVNILVCKAILMLEHARETSAENDRVRQLVDQILDTRRAKVDGGVLFIVVVIRRFRVVFFSPS
jgi:hypothetical protein